METRFRGSQRDPHRRGGIRQRQAEVVVKDDDGALIRVEVTDATFDLISIGRDGLRVRHRWGMLFG
jgi:hypothetical protein